MRATTPRLCCSTYTGDHDYTVAGEPLARAICGPFVEEYFNIPAVDGRKVVLHASDEYVEGWLELVMTYIGNQSRVCWQVPRREDFGCTYGWMTRWLVTNNLVKAEESRTVWFEMEVVP